MNNNIPTMKQKTIQLQLMVNDHTMIHQPGTEIMLTSGCSPKPQIPDGIYLIDHHHTIKVTIRNSSTATMLLRQNTPIQGIVAHDLKQTYHTPVEITEDTLKALRLNDHALKTATQANINKKTIQCINLEKKSQKLTSFKPHFKNAKYSWARMPQGLNKTSTSLSKN